MAKKRIEEKQRYWRAVLERQAVSGVSIAKFCRSEGVSEPSFYSWKRALAGGKAKARRAERSGARRATGRISETSASFVPVQITEEPRPATIQVVWPNGLSVQVPSECDPAEVQAVLQMVDGLSRQR
jgi:hypothetical protein